jgi:hypothetical protein
MMDFALKYRKTIDDVTADKKLKLRSYELDNEEWKIIEELVSVLRVMISFFSVGSARLIKHGSATNRQHFISRRIVLVLQQLYRQWTQSATH